jgi:glutamate-ammonia-ligase adenylyltransferase
MERELADEGPGRWNLKTGRGGTVDVEFLAQMLVLRHGTEHPAVRCRNTEEALAALFAQRLLPGEDYATLVEGYRFLRRLANRLRLERDQPVEALEDDAAQLDALARWLGYAGSEEERLERLRREVEETREAIRGVYQRFFGAAADLRV